MSKQQKSVLIFLGILNLFAIFIWVTVDRFWDGTRVDFPSYYYGAKLTFEEDLSPYTRDHWDYAIELFDQEQDLYPYVYIPPSVFLFYPLLNLDYQTSQSVLFILNHVLIALFFWLFLYRIFKIPSHSVLPLIAAGYIFFFSPLKMELRAGQMDIIVLVLLCVTWWALKEKKHPAFVILSMVVVILLKLTPILFLFILLIRKEYKAILWIVVILLALSLIAHFTLPENMWIDWYEWVGSRGYGQVISTRLGPPGFGNQNINAFFSRIFLGREPGESIFRLPHLAARDGQPLDDLFLGRGGQLADLGLDRIPKTERGSLPLARFHLFDALGAHVSHRPVITRPPSRLPAARLVRPLPLSSG
jgi:hypothetical protein